MGLEKYWQKRDFKKTPEPHGNVATPKGESGFVIQMHAARHLHYDFRLELDGVLKSWAIPKGPSLDPAEKRLAVHVEDHPLDYGNFEGIIPEKQYGAGSVLLWDRGVWFPEGDAMQGYRKGRLKFRLAGEKLHGGWTLIRMGKASKASKENWLLIKEKDEYAVRGAKGEVTSSLTQSVASGRNMQAIASRDESPRFRQNTKPKDTKSYHSIPDMVKPQLATLVDEAPADKVWLYEQKFDGYRILCRIHEGQVSLFTRSGKDWTSKLKHLAQAIGQLPIQDGWLDGEIVVVLPDGSTSFQALQNAFEEGATSTIQYCVFDLLYLNGHDLTRLPLIDRKQLLAEILRDANSVIRYSEHIETGGKAFYEQACRLHLEGIIGKRRDAPYVSGRTDTWIKVKCRRQQEFVIGGFTDPAGTRKAFGALLLGVYDDQGRLQHAGKVGTGFNEKSLTTLHKRLLKLVTSEPPFVNPPTGATARGVHWVKPMLVAQCTFAEWTKDGSVRQASFDGLREDKPASSVTREKVSSLANHERKRNGALSVNAKKISSTDASDASIAGIRLTHPDKLLYPSQQLTKKDIARYYESIGDWILPHLARRPLTLVRCPRGAEEKCFFQKHVDEKLPGDVERVEIQEDNGVGLYAVVNSLSALIGLVQMGVLEFHTAGALTDRLDRPNRMIFDLDPDISLPWKRTAEGALLVRTLLQEIGLESFVKTTGGKGLHVVVPLQRKHSWEDVKKFSRAVATHLASSIPDRFTASLSKRQRTNKIFIDYLRNAEGATAVAAYSTRAKANAPVSVPVAWESLSDDMRSDYFNVKNLMGRLKMLSDDPWANYTATQQSLTLTMKRKLGLDE